MIAGAHSLAQGSTDGDEALVIAMVALQSVIALRGDSCRYLVMCGNHYIKQDKP